MTYRHAAMRAQVVGISGLLAATLAGACGGDGEAPAAPISPEHPPVNTSWLDKRANPCDDFYQYACGGWSRSNGLGNGQSQKTTFFKSQDEMWQRSIKLIKDFAAARATSKSAEEKVIGNYFQACMDAPKQPGERAKLAAVIAKIDPIASLDDYARIAAEVRKAGVAGVFNHGVWVDLEDSSRHLAVVAGVGNYVAASTLTDPMKTAALDRYKQHITTLATKVGVTVDPAAVIRVETELAKIKLPDANPLDPRDGYNPMSFADFTALAPRFPWRVFFDAFGFPVMDRIIVQRPEYLVGLEKALAAVSVEDLKHHLRWRVLDARAYRLDQELLTEEFQYHDVFIAGRTTQLPRDFYCLSATDSTLSSILARPYIERFFDGQLRSRARELIGLLRTSFKNRINTRDWLDEPTRAAALRKLDAISEKVAYPEPWPSIPIAQTFDSWMDESLATSELVSSDQIRRLSERPDRGSWSDSPIVINAYYRASRNEIVFPAGILQVPHFDPKRPRVANLGAIGVTMGHELTHGFDSRGRHFDDGGNLRDWWTPSVGAEYDRRAQCLIDRYGAFELFPGEKVDGKLSLTENIADLGGVRLAYDAFKANDANSPAYEGLDARQQFFISYGQVWCTVETAAVARSRLRDSHAPPRLRVNAPLAQMPEFAEAFSCPAGAPMPGPVCEIW